jgi:hypothetical protein
VGLCLGSLGRGDALDFLGRDLVSPFLALIFRDLFLSHSVWALFCVCFLVFLLVLVLILFLLLLLDLEHSPLFLVFLHWNSFRKSVISSSFLLPPLVDFVFLVLVYGCYSRVYWSLWYHGGSTLVPFDAKYGMVYRSWEATHHGSNKVQMIPNVQPPSFYLMCSRSS